MRSIASLVLAAALGGCSLSAPLPDLDPRLVADCANPPASAGQDARVVAKRKNKTIECEVEKKRAIVGFYIGLQAARATKGLRR